MILQLDEAKKELADLIAQISELGESIKIREAEKEHQEYSDKINSDGFWNEISEANEILKKSKILSDKIKDFRNLESFAESTYELVTMAISENDESLTADILREVSEIKTEFIDFQLKTLLDGEYDNNNAIISIHPGAGGTEAQDWAEMLYRMYMRYA